MKLPAAQREELLAALVDAFTDYAQLDIVAGHLDQTLDTIVDTKNRRIASHQLIRWAEANDAIDDLVVAARKEQPRNLLLRRTAESLQLVSSPYTADYERIVVPAAGFQDPGSWRERMSLVELTVCRIEVIHPTKGRVGIGTGFLVGSNLVFTNDHVRMEWEKSSAPEDVVLRFGYAKKGDVEVEKGTEYKLKKGGWLIANSSPDQGLDYALVATEGDPGRERLGRAASSPLRRWLIPEPHTFSPGEPLLILQHPKARPLELAIGSVVGEVANNRVEHKVNTEGGSSGSPCFTVDWRLVCLHYWGDKTANRAISFRAILKDLADKKVVLPEPPSEDS